MNRILSWPGAKYRQMNELTSVLDEYKLKPKIVCEPFFGTGAFSWEMLENYNAEEFIYAEKDVHLFWLLEHLIHNTQEFIYWINKWKELFIAAKDNKDDYNNMRSTYNNLYVEAPQSVKTAGLLWCLIYQSTNNLARFNKSGEYNQTHGKGRVIPDTDKVFDTSTLDCVNKFAANSIGSPDFSVAIKNLIEHYKNLADVLSPEDIIVFLDPPYLIRTETYQKGCWSTKDEKNLWEYCMILDKYNIPWMMTNYLSKDDSVTGEVIQHPYKKFINNKYIVRELKRKMDSRPTGKGTEVEEVIILGGWFNNVQRKTYGSIKYCDYKLFDYDDVKVKF